MYRGIPFISEFGICGFELDNSTIPPEMFVLNIKKSFRTRILEKSTSISISYWNLFVIVKTYWSTCSHHISNVNENVNFLMMIEDCL